MEETGTILKSHSNMIMQNFQTYNQMDWRRSPLKTDQIKHVSFGLASSERQVRSRPVVHEDQSAFGKLLKTASTSMFDDDEDHHSPAHPRTPPRERNSAVLTTPSKIPSQSPLQQKDQVVELQETSQASDEAQPRENRKHETDTLESIIIGHAEFIKRMEDECRACGVYSSEADGRLSSLLKLPSDELLVRVLAKHEELTKAGIFATAR